MRITTLMLFVLSVLTYTANSQNLYTLANAANIENEVNATTGWSGPAALASVTDSPHDGTWCIRITTQNNGNRAASFVFNAVSGTTYNITIWAKRGTNNSNSAFKDWVNFTGFTETSIATTTWQQYSFTVTATTSSPTIRVYGSTSGPSGRVAYIDGITITAQVGDTQAPTAPTNLTSTNTTSSATTLTWSASTDNVGVTQYQIRQNNSVIGSVAGNITTYNVSGLSASTTYSFNVVALDAANNVSPASNTVQVTTLQGSGGITYTSSNSNLPTVNWQSNDLYVAGNMGVGTAPNANYSLAVNGVIRNKELVVQSGWSDFVFEKDYQLATMREIETYIIEHGHLKDIPSAAQVHENGIQLSEINMRLLQKIEELTLYVIDADKRLQLLENEKRKLLKY